ncbi:MAG: precorrin-8X methylmutase [Eubacterium sp.]|nr:precorrin-8X methylmutase [Eubacterium sp.]
MEFEHVKPADIERRSFEIITQELKDNEIEIEERYAPIIKRAIHTSADFDYADNLVFSEGVLEQAIAALKSGATIVTDTKMAWSGINKKVVQKLGGKVECFVADEEVASAAKEHGTTRSVAAVDKAFRDYDNLIYVVGNAPTALIRIREIMDETGKKPALVVGVPVGFVNVVPSKELIINSDVPHIVARGRKGGSNVAAAIMNALLYMIDETRGM